MFLKTASLVFMPFLLYESTYMYCLIECWPFDQVSRFKNPHSFPCFHKISWKCPIIQSEKPQVQLFSSSCLRLLLLSAFNYNPEMSFMFFGRLRTEFSSSIITLTFQRGMRVIQPVMSPNCFGHAKMTANLGLHQPT